MPQTIEKSAIHDPKSEIPSLVDRGLKLSRDLKALAAKQQELDAIKQELRDLAKGKDVDFKGTGANVARVEQKADTIARVVANEDVLFVAKHAGPNLTDLFTLHPSKGNEKNFELNALKLLVKKSAQAIIDRLTVPATAWVRFS